MATTDMFSQQVWNKGRVMTPADNIVMGFGRQKVGATGAVATSNLVCPGNPGLTITRDSAGVYTFSLPKGDILWVNVIATDATLTQAPKCTAVDLTNGTITFTCLKETEAENAPVFTATDPAENSYLLFQYAVANGD